MADGEPMMPDEIRETLADWFRRPTGRARLQRLAGQFRDILHREGFAEPLNVQDVRQRCGQDSALGLMADFIWHWEVIRRESEAEGQKLETIVEFAQRCGQIRAELAIKFGIDPDTDMKRQDLMEKGRTFSLSSRLPRSDALAQLIDRALADTPQASAKEMLRKIQEIDGGRTIQAIDEAGNIEWRAGPRDERDTSFRAFEKRLSKRRKKISA